VPGDVTGSADILLNSHVQAPEEAKHRAGEYDEILAWLDWEFRKSDLNKDGCLDYPEFMRFVRSLDLKLGTKEVFQFFTLADRDNDERIVWNEVPCALSVTKHTLMYIVP
jgi:Ca2+-binding EF-hand superfamily protein